MEPAVCIECYEVIPVKKRSQLRYFLLVNAGILCALALCSLAGNKAVTTYIERAPIKQRRCYIIDAGHGGVDGGATSCTGVLESEINLQISLRLNDLMNLLGMDTLMIRTTDQSVYTQGSTIAAKKVSDLKQRVKIVNQTNGAVLVSIHQNYFDDSRYAGSQVFYAPGEVSENLAKQMQTALVRALRPDSRRLAKKAEGIYLMQNINSPGILIECGFLSNSEEETKLRSAQYQKQLCCVIASVLSKFNSDIGIT